VWRLIVDADARATLVLTGCMLTVIARGHESVPIQLAQCRFPGLATEMLKYQYISRIKYTEAILSNSTRKLYSFEITKMLIAVSLKNNKLTVSFVIIFGTPHFRPYCSSEQ